MGSLAHIMRWLHAFYMFLLEGCCQPVWGGKHVSPQFFRGWRGDKPRWESTKRCWGSIAALYRWHLPVTVSGHWPMALSQSRSATSAKHTLSHDRMMPASDPNPQSTYKVIHNRTIHTKINHVASNTQLVELVFCCFETGGVWNTWCFECVLSYELLFWMSLWVQVSKPVCMNIFKYMVWHCLNKSKCIHVWHIYRRIHIDLYL